MKDLEEYYVLKTSPSSKFIKAKGKSRRGEQRSWKCKMRMYGWNVDLRKKVATKKEPSHTMTVIEGNLKFKITNNYY